VSKTAKRSAGTHSAPGAGVQAITVIDPANGYPRIRDYALIGDCRSAALVSNRGSIDWLCLPRFDSPSLFAALLDRTRGGRFSICPCSKSSVTRRYVDDSNVLETTFTTDTGRLVLTDLMPVASESDKRRELGPDHEVLRVVECTDGEVELDVHCDPRPNYGKRIPNLIDRGPFGWFYEHGSRALALRSEIPLQRVGTAPGVRGRVALRAGERRRISLSFVEAEPAVLPALGEYADARVQRSIAWWQDWAQRCTYNGPFRQQVVRSALTLKLMTYAPSGALVAAPTTSLPEKIGNVRNWDYRYCWLRDASFTLRALLDLGYGLEAEAFLSWLLQATRLKWPELQIMYDVYGETKLKECELPHLDGYAGSKPVRIGNGALDQLQLDVYGEVVDATLRFVKRGGTLDRTSARMVLGFGNTVIKRWNEPDEGIWEPRSGRKHHTYSKAMCWVAMQRLARMHADRHVEVPHARFANEAEAIKEVVEMRGYDQDMRSYVAAFDSKDLDSSLLLLGLHGYADVAGERMKNTLQAVRERLGVNGLLYRYLGNDGLPIGEGAFALCSFWEIQLLALMGRTDECGELFEKLLGYANDVGLLAEEIDPGTGELLGNFPQAYTHVGVINCAVKLEEAIGKRSAPPEDKGQKQETATQR
jgi:GH15 family glucan-1,4-alpha-glucosidase